MWFCLIFGAVLRKFFLKLWYCVLQNQADCGFEKFSGNFYTVCGFLMLFCAVVIHVQFHKQEIKKI